MLDVFRMGWWDDCRRAVTIGAIRGAVALSHRLGPTGGLQIGRAMGDLACYARPLRRRLATNLRRAGIAPSETVLDKYFHRFGAWAGWSLATCEAGLEASGLVDRMQFGETTANLDKAVALGRGVILACPHLFCHELAAAAVNRRHPVVALVRESKSEVRSALKARWYQATGMETIRRPRHSSVVADVMANLRVLRSGRLLGVTPDLLVPPSSGVMVRMFGRDVSLSPGIVVLSMRSGAPIVTASCDWFDGPAGRGPWLRMKFSEPMEFPRTGDRERIIHEGFQDWCTSCETLLRQHPEDWMFWLDKRWSRALAAPPRLASPARQGDRR